ncbi:MAG TPA: lysine-sensitive aspartokinase 3 [Candidatus Kapabacteria bacterium]|nr:lysine-sensitive aspartokinase 3 [Candidatus Kapabacteria bacterium]
MVVMKFGGTSVKDANAIRNVINIVRNRYPWSWIVVSALSGVTNKLVKISENLQQGNLSLANELADEIEIIHLKLADSLEIIHCKQFVSNYISHLKSIFAAINVLGELTPKSIDLILATGEILSSKLIAEYAIKVGLNAVHCDSTQIIKTDSVFNAAELDFGSTKKQINDFLLANSKVDYYISGGFIASDCNNNITTLGRGGSDYTAAVISQAIEAKCLEIWTDVDGILTCDPRLVKNAKLISQVSYQEAAELAYFGAKVLHPKTIYPAVSQDIPVYVLNSTNPTCNGTLISRNPVTTDMIKSIAFRRNITLINIISNRMLGAFGFLAKVFEVFKNNRVSVDLVSTTEVSISLTIDYTESLAKIINELSNFATIEQFTNMANISAIGSGMRATSGIASRFFTTLKGVNISMVTFGASEVNLSVVIKDDELEKAVTLLHKEFFDGLEQQDIFQELN